MLRRCFLLLKPRQGGVVKSALTPLEVLTQIQLGITPSLAVQRGFMLEHCESQLESRGVTEAKLIAMDGRLCTQLMKQLVLERYLSVPFRVFSFDMEFTGPPVFTAEGPTEDITEVGLYSPQLDETFSCLVQPACGRKQGPGVEELTHISDEMLAKEGVPFVEAWRRFLDFVQTPQPGELPGAEERILLLSHGGKLADVSLIKWTLEKFNLALPPSFVFGDTIHLIRDAHRRRPVTVDKHPPSWKLGDLVQWLHIPPTLPAHRAGNDARMTWDALYHTLLRYGDDELTPREQLIPRFFDEEAKRRMRAASARQAAETDPLTMDDTFLLADAAMSSSALARAEHGGGGVADGDAGAGAAGGHQASAKASASPDLMDLDFDDIFSASHMSSGAAGGSSMTATEFLLDEDAASAAPQTAHEQSASSSLSSAAPVSDAVEEAQRPSRGRKTAAKKQQKPPGKSKPASAGAATTFDTADAAGDRDGSGDAVYLV